MKAGIPSFVETPLESWGESESVLSLAICAQISLIWLGTGAYMTIPSSSPKFEPSVREFSEEILIPFSVARDLQLSAMSARLLSPPTTERAVLAASGEQELSNNLFENKLLLSGVFRVDEPAEVADRKLNGE